MRLILPAGLLALAAAGAAIPDAFVPAPPPVEILPAPKELRWGQGAFDLTASTRIVVGERAAAEDLFAADELNEELAARFGITLPVVRAPQVPSPRGQIIVGEAGLNRATSQALGGQGPPLRPEGYLLAVTPRTVVVAGADRRGTFYGVQTLRQLLRPAGDAGQGGAVARVRTVTIRDWPDHPVRAVHVLLDGASGEFHSALVDRILAPYKFNTLIAQAEHVQWESGRPFWTPDPRGARKSDVRRLLETARRHHIQVIPLIATLGHSEWVFSGLRSEALCREIAFIPRRLREEGRTQVTCDRARGVVPSVYDPERKVNIGGAEATVTEALILPVLREAVELFQPTTLHIGHDEVRGPAGLRYDLDLYLRDVIALHRFLGQQGVRTMLWGDVLWERREEVAAEPLAAELPRDLTIVAWKYEDAREYPELAHFRQAGFAVMGATWFRPHNNFHFSLAARAAGAAGMVRTTWTGQFQNRAALTRAYRQLYTYLTAAAYFWTAGRPRPEALADDAALARRFADAWQPASYRGERIGGSIVDLRRAVTARHVDDGGGWLDKGPDYDLRALAPGRRRLGGIVFEILDPARQGGRSVVMLKGERDVAAAMPQRVRVPLGRPAGCLVFLHTALDQPPTFGEVIGSYTITLADGGSHRLELAYGRNIASWLADADRGIPSIEQEVAWTGRTRAGNEVLLVTARWQNPRPAQAVAAIELHSAGGRASPVVFAITALDRCPAAPARP